MTHDLNRPAPIDFDGPIADRDPPFRLADIVMGHRAGLEPLPLHTDEAGHFMELVQVFRQHVAHQHPSIGILLIVDVDRH